MAFESALRKVTKAKYCCVVSNASVALHTAYLALGVGPDDHVWVANNTFASTATSAIMCGAIVTPIEISLSTFNLDIDDLSVQLEKASELGNLPKVIAAVDFGGLPSASQELKYLSERYGFKILVDSAHGIGSQIGNIPTGANPFSDITVFSFHAIKIITSGEGGALTTNDEELAEKIAYLRSHGIVRVKNPRDRELNGELWNYDVAELGYNYRMTDIQAALGHSQLKKLKSFIKIRHKLMDLYRKELDTRFTLQEVHSNLYSAYHLNTILLPDTMVMKKREIINQLAEKSIQLNYHYIPINKLKLIERINGKTKMQKSDEYFQRAITLPLHQKLTNDNVLEVCSELNQCI